MSFDLSKIKKQTVKSPPRICIYGEPGIGKTTFGIGNDRTILFNIEKGGADRLNAARMFPVDSEITGDMVFDALEALKNQEHNFLYIAIDTLDWLEELFFADICRENNVKRIDAISYGRGYELMIAKWKRFYNELDQLQQSKKMGVILLAHSQIVTVKDPILDQYDRHELRLNKKSAGLLKEWVEIIGFAHRKIMTSKVDEKFGKSEFKAIGTGQRILSLNAGEEGFLSKSRFELPAEMPLVWDQFEKIIIEQIKGVK